MALERLRERWEQITPRERTLVAVLGAAAVLGIVLFIAFSIKSKLTALAEKNDTTRLALQSMARHRQTLAEQGPADVAAKITTEAIKLDTYVDEIISELKLQSPAYPSKKENAKGKFVEVTMDIRMPKPLTIFELKDLLEKIETKDPKVIVRDLNIRRNFTDKDKLDITMVIATYYEKPKAKAAGDGDGAGEPDAGGSGS